MRNLRAAVVAVIGVACASSGSGPSSMASVTGSFRADDRIVFPSSTVVTAIAVSERFTFVAGTDGLAIYDSQFSQWLPPVSRVDGWPDTPVTIMMADPADPAAVWFAAENFVYRFRVGIEGLVRTLVPQRVSASSFFVEAANPAGGVIVGGGAMGFTRVSPTGFAQPYRPANGGRITPQTPAFVYQRFASLRNFERLLTRDNSMQTWPVTAAAAHPVMSEVWLGTAGGGVFRVDPTFSRSQQVPFGLISDGAGAVTRAADGVWFGGLGLPTDIRHGLTFAESSLRTWRWLDGGMASPLDRARVLALTVWESSIWAATDRGLLLIDGRTGNVSRRWDELSGLANSLVYSLAPTPDGTWAGTARGLAFARSNTPGARTPDVETTMLAGTAVRALVRRGDTLWIGSDAGLAILEPGARAPRAFRISATDTRFALPITSIATADSVVVFSTVNGDIVRVHTRTGAPMDDGSFVQGDRVGRINAMAMDANTLWIAGDRGVVAVHRETRAQRFLTSGRDIPGEAYGIVLTREYAWIAAREGGVRVRRLDDGMMR